jgi:tubulin polyglutamylase TTLL6/13
LLQGLKSDLRIYVLVVSSDPLKIFIHEEGLVRFATQPYEPIELGSSRRAMSNLFVHLTNYSLNKENSDFKSPKGINDDKAHKRTLTGVFKTLKKLGKDVEKMWNEIKDIIIKTMLSI